MTYSSKGLIFDNVLPYNIFICTKQRQVYGLQNDKMKESIWFGYLTRFEWNGKSECTEISISDILNQRTTNRSTNNFDY